MAVAESGSRGSAWSGMPRVAMSCSSQTRQPLPSATPVIATIEANVAVGDASGIALPLARDCLAAIGANPKDEELLPCTVELLNGLQVEGAHRYVYYHPGGRLKAFAQACLGTQPAVD